MRRVSLSLAAALALLASLVIPAFRAVPALAQDSPNVEKLFQISLEDAELPPTRIYMRLLWINMAPGSSNPRHTHPGPELWRVDTGTVTVELQGPGLIVRNGQDKQEAAPTDKSFELQKGDRLAILPSTPMAFSNKSDADVRILAAVILPAGHQAPPGIDYMGKTPAADAYEGLSFPILGDGLLENVPAGTKTVTIDRIRLAAGQPIPAEANPVLISVARGSLDFTVNAGTVNISRTATPGPQETPIAPGTAVTLGRYDAAFFPNGLKEVPRAEGLADVTLFRLSIVGDQSAATPIAADQVGDISITGPAAENTPTPEATATPAEQPTKEASAEPTITGGSFQEGQTVYVNDTDVRLRDSATTDSNIVTGLTQGQALVITGPSVTADDITWWPVASPDDASYVGWVAEQFLSTEPVE